MPRRTAPKRDDSERGSQAEPRFLIVGRIRKPHGVRGELKVAVHTDEPARFYDLERVFVSRYPDDHAPRELTVTNVRFHSKDALVTLDGYTSKESSAELNSQWLFVALEDAVPLEEDEIYTFQLIGMSAVTTSGQQLGEVQRILETGANDVLVIDGPLGEVLVPDIPDVVQQVDTENGNITIEPLPGLLPE